MSISRPRGGSPSSPPPRSTAAGSSCSPVRSATHAEQAQMMAWQAEEDAEREALHRRLREVESELEQVAVLTKSRPRMRVATRRRRRPNSRSAGRPRPPARPGGARRGHRPGHARLGELAPHRAVARPQALSGRPPRPPPGRPRWWLQFYGMLTALRPTNAAIRPSRLPRAGLPPAPGRARARSVAPGVHVSLLLPDDHDLGRCTEVRPGRTDRALRRLLDAGRVRRVPEARPPRERLHLGDDRAPAPHRAGGRARCLRALPPGRCSPGASP